MPITCVLTIDRDLNQEGDNCNAQQISTQLAEWLLTKPGVLSANPALCPLTGKHLVYYTVWTPSQEEVRKALLSARDRSQRR